MTKIENKRVDRIIIVVLLILLMIVVFSWKSNSQERISYRVCYTTPYKVKCINTSDTLRVQEIVNMKFREITINVNKQLKHSNYIQIMTENGGVYIEKQRIVVTKKGKVKYKKLKK